MYNYLTTCMLTSMVSTQYLSFLFSQQSWKKPLVVQHLNTTFKKYHVSRSALTTWQWKSRMYFILYHLISILNTLVSLDTQYYNSASCILVEGHMSTYSHNSLPSGNSQSSVWRTPCKWRGWCVGGGGAHVKARGVCVCVGAHWGASMMRSSSSSSFISSITSLQSEIREMLLSTMTALPVTFK